MQLSKNQSSVIYNGVLEAFRHIKTNEGWLGFYKGFGTNLLRACVGSIVLVCYDELKSNLN